MPIVMSVSTGTDWVERREFRKRRDKNLIQSVIQLFSSSFLSFLLHSIHRSSFCCLSFLLILLPTLSFTLFKNSPILRSTYSEGRSRLNRKILLPSFPFHFIPFLLLLLPLVLFLEEEILKKFDHPVSRESPSSLLFFPSLFHSLFLSLFLTLYFFLPSFPSPFSVKLLSGHHLFSKIRKWWIFSFFILFNVLFLSSFPLLVSLMISLVFLSFLPQFPLSSHTFSLSSFFWKRIFPHNDRVCNRCPVFERNARWQMFQKSCVTQFQPYRKERKEKKGENFWPKRKRREERKKERGILNKSQRVKKTGHRWYSFYWIKTRVIESMFEGKRERERRKGREREKKRERERRKGRERGMATNQPVKRSGSKSVKKEPKIDLVQRDSFQFLLFLSETRVHRRMCI